MASDDTITFVKKKTYTMPEDNWDSVDDWFESVKANIENLDSLGESNHISIDATYRWQSKELKEALQTRFDNKDSDTGEFGYGKVMKSIIGEYVITLEDKAGLQKKISIMGKIIEYFNEDEQLSLEDPAGKAEVVDEGLSKIESDDAVNLTVAVIAVEGPSKLSVGRAMGFLNQNFPHLKPQMKELAGKVAKRVAIINQRVRDGEIEQIKEEAINIYPTIFNRDDSSKSGETDRIYYQFPANDLEPSIVRYQIGEEVKEIEITKIIRRMKHDKAAYAWLNQHKPNGGPQWPQGGSGNYYLVISNDPFMNFTKSSGRYWETQSCERYNSYDGNYAKGPLSDIIYGNCVVFAFKGDSLQDTGWPYQQPTNRPQGNISNDPDGTLLGRQNIKWGYKENIEGDIGMGLDPAFYPRSGGATWPKLLNKALALIVDSVGYLNYKSMTTPYKYIGHCDVGSGMGILTYRAGTTCYTKIEQGQVNPDLIMAGDESIGYVAFDRLTRPIVDLNIKLILAQNPNIWAIAGNETGIGRLIRTKNIDIIRFLIASPDADTEALLGIIDIIPEVDVNWKDPYSFSNLPYLIAKHPNADERVYQKLLDTHPGFTTDDITYSALQVLFGGITQGWDNIRSNTPYVCFGDINIIDQLLKNEPVYVRGRGSAYPEQMINYFDALLFAPHLTPKQLNTLLSKIKESRTHPSICEFGGYTPTINNSLLYAYTLPLEEINSWAFNDDAWGIPFSLSTYSKFTFDHPRQTPEFLEVISKNLLDSDYADKIIRSTRNKKCFNWIWRKRRRFKILPANFTRYSIGIESFSEPYPTPMFETKHFMSALEAGELEGIRYEFITGDVKTPRKQYPPKFVRSIISDIQNIENLGWGVVAGWLNEEPQFFQYIDLVYQKGFKNLYLGRGNFATPPEDIFELYNEIEDIDVLNEASVDSINNLEGLARNPNLPYTIQNMITNLWFKLSEDYEGGYGEYLSNLQKAMAQNPNSNPLLLKEYSEDINLKHLVASNPNVYMKTLFKLYSQYPSEVMTNQALSDSAYSKLWNNTWKTLNIQLIENPNRLFNGFRYMDIFNGDKGSHMRNNIISYIKNNKAYKFWRGGTIKKGRFSQIAPQNMFSEPITDYPLFPKGKVIVVKFSETVEDRDNNEVYYLDKMEKVDDDTVFIEGEKFTNIDRKFERTHVAETVSLNEFFNYIPESLREEIIIETNEEGEEIKVTPARWTIENIVVIQDSEVIMQSETIPQWRFDINQEQVNNILVSYINRGMNLSKLIEEMETPKNLKNYQLNLRILFQLIDDNNLWTKEIIGDNLSFIMRSQGAIFRRTHNMPLTEDILNLSILTDASEFENYGIFDMALKDLPAIQNKILEREGLPIAYIYHLMTTTTDSSVLKSLKGIRRQRGPEFIEYYRKLHPAPKR